MKSFFGRLFNVKRGEARLVILLSLLLMGNSIARQMTGIVGISDLINTGGVNQTLVVNAINGVLIFLTALMASLIIDRFNRIELLKWTTFSFAIIFVMLDVVSLINGSEKIVAALVYLMSQQQWLLFPMFFWVLSNDIFSMSQAKRLIPAIGSWSFIGKVAGIGLTLLPALFFNFGWVDEKVLTMGQVIRLNTFFYLIAFLLVNFSFNKLSIRPIVKTEESVKETLTEGFDFVREVQSFRLLLLSIIFIGAIDVILEYRFFVVSKNSISNPVDYKQFYSLYLLAAALLSFSIQGFVTSRIVQRFELKNTFLIQPFVALSTTIAMIFSPELIVTSIGSLFLKIGRNTIDESTRKAFQGFVPEERRGRVALFTDNFAPAIGMLIASVLTGAIVLIAEKYGVANSFYVYLGLAALFALISVLLIQRMRASYDTSLFNWRLKRRKRGNSDILKKLDF